MRTDLRAKFEAKKDTLFFDSPIKYSKQMTQL